MKLFRKDVAIKAINHESLANMVWPEIASLDYLWNGHHQLKQLGKIQKIMGARVKKIRNERPHS